MTEEEPIQEEPIVARARACPHCGSANTRKDGVLRRRPSFVMTVLVGWLYLLIRGAFGRCAAQCDDCSERFRYKTVGSWVALAVLITLIVLFIMAVQQQEQMMGG